MSSSSNIIDSEVMNSLMQTVTEQKMLHHLLLCDCVQYSHRLKHTSGVVEIFIPCPAVLLLSVEGLHQSMMAWAPFLPPSVFVPNGFFSFSSVVFLLMIRVREVRVYYIFVFRLTYFTFVRASVIIFRWATSWCADFTNRSFV